MNFFSTRVFPVSVGARKKNRGVSIIEVLIASAIIMTSVVSIMGVYGGLTSIAIRNTAKVQAGMLLDEGAEALRYERC